MPTSSWMAPLLGFIVSLIGISFPISELEIVSLSGWNITSKKVIYLDLFQSVFLVSDCSNSLCLLILLFPIWIYSTNFCISCINLNKCLFIFFLWMMWLFFFLILCLPVHFCSYFCFFWSFVSALIPKGICCVPLHNCLFSWCNPFQGCKIWFEIQKLRWH